MKVSNRLKRTIFFGISLLGWVGFIFCITLIILEPVPEDKGSSETYETLHKWTSAEPIEVAIITHQGKKWIVTSSSSGISTVKY